MKITVNHGNHSFEITEKDVKKDRIVEAVNQAKPGVTYFGYPVYDTVYRENNKRYVLCPACGIEVVLS